MASIVVYTVTLFILSVPIRSFQPNFDFFMTKFIPIQRRTVLLSTTAQTNNPRLRKTTCLYGILCPVVCKDSMGKSNPTNTVKARVGKSINNNNALMNLFIRNEFEPALKRFYPIPGYSYFTFYFFSQSIGTLRTCEKPKVIFQLKHFTS